ncbi:hypothetical protein [Geobacter argillaceus]|uniref:YtkA-like protein n=1 Tax=Geobacter argillaceus TaxID=345631 RepID=A0A562VPP0_9BACT|nr:hypothetical protein [Geobacter argillaceus]TWJ19741.1 hypothetical protein JN12_01542 [Geobacter argillaceus]
MNKLILLFMLITLPSAAFALEQSFTQQGLKASVKLSPEKLETQSTVQLSLGLSKDGASLTDRNVTLEVYERNVDQPIIKRSVDVLDGEYIDSWKFEKTGDYKVVINISDHQKPDEIIHYEINATVGDAVGEQEDHGFFAHHFGGGKWGWWGTGLMLLMMVPMMIIVL